MQIGKIVKSNTQVDYVCQINNPGEYVVCPSPQDYAFGTFVRVELPGENDYLVGLIYNTTLMNPEYGSLGPARAGGSGRHRGCRPGDEARGRASRGAFVSGRGECLG